MTRACVAALQTWELFGELQSNGNPKEALAAYTKVCNDALWILSSLLMCWAFRGPHGGVGRWEHLSPSDGIH